MTTKYAQYVDTIIGTIADVDTPGSNGTAPFAAKFEALYSRNIGSWGAGKTYPGSVFPFGMVQLSPDTYTGGDNTSGYSYHHDTIEGFSFMRMSGTGWYGEFGNLQVMPITGEMKFHSGTNIHDIFQASGEGWRSPFRHETEVTEAGYYAVTLDKYNIRAEMTTTQRAGLLRFRFPASSSGKILIDFARRIGGRSDKQYVRINEQGAIEGWVDCSPQGGGFGHGDAGISYRLFFYGMFNTEWDSVGFWNQGVDLGLHDEYTAEDLGLYANFATAENQQILFKMGVSFVGIAGAKLNLETELDHWDFEQVKFDSKRAWDQALSSIKVEGSTEKTMQIFYTAMYHAMLDPRDVADVDGRYFGADKRIHRRNDFVYRTLFSGWDAFRSAMPLMTLIRPDLVNDELNSLIEIAHHLKTTYPRWELMGFETSGMVGDPGVVLFADAYQKGIRNYDVGAAYELAKQTAFAENSNRGGREEMNTLGYVPGQISITLENVYADWCIYQLAELMGDRETAEVFKQRALNYKLIYDETAGWMRRRDEFGAWMEFGGKYDGRGCVESNIYQQSWFVPHDVYGLMNLMGKSRFLQELELFFQGADLTAFWNDNYNHSNEPVHHVPHLFCYAGQPWRTQYWVRQIQLQAYNTGPFGYCGNEDVGQMSAWYVLTAVGFHPVSPGNGIYIMNTPLFKRSVIQLSEAYHSCDVDTQFIIETDCDPATHLYIHSISLNGLQLDRCWITHGEVAAGGTLKLILGVEPNQTFGVDNPPPSLSDGA